MLLKIAEDIRKELAITRNDAKAISNKFSTKDIKVDAADMGFRSLSDIPDELAARVSTITSWPNHRT